MNLTAPRSKRVTILVVDDNQDNLVLLEQQVSILMDCAIVTAATGDSALTQARQFQPDLILLDVMLPDKDGLQVIQILKDDARTSAIPIVAVTAMARVEDEQRAAEAGCCGYLRKPYELEDLETLLRHHFPLSCALAS